MCSSFLAKYAVLEKIGEGSFSEVLKCQDRKTGVLYAAKRLKKIYQNVNEVLESPEVLAMRKVSRHANVLYMFESHYDMLPGKVTLIFELMDMSLYDLMRNRKGRLLLEMHVKHYVYQMLRGLDHLHKHGIFHRDVKPENILLKGNEVKIGDLGSIRGIYSRPPYTEYISTRWYRSPECLLTGGFYGPKMDIWAAGCVFFELLTLEPLFPGENEVDQISKIHNVLGTPHPRIIAKFRRISNRNGDFYFPMREGYGLTDLVPELSSLGLDVLELMLIYDPESRASARKLLDHKYFNDMRERELRAQTRSGRIGLNPSGDSRSWRNPQVLPYIAAERNQRFRSHLRCADSFKPVESTSNARFSSQPQVNVHQESRPDELGHSSRHFLRKRHSLQQSNRLNSLQTKKSWYETNAKMSRFYDKETHPYQRERVNVNSSRIPVACQSYHGNENLSVSGVQMKKNPFGSKSQLPSIFQKPNRQPVSIPDSTYVVSDNVYKISLSCIGDLPMEDFKSLKGVPIKRLGTIKSPLKKAKHDVVNSYYRRAMSFDRCKFPAKKPYD